MKIDKEKVKSIADSYNKRCTEIKKIERKKKNDRESISYMPHNLKRKR